MIGNDLATKLFPNVDPIGREILIDGILHGVQNVVRVHIKDGGIAGHRSCPFDIEIRLRQVVLHHTRIAEIGDDDHLRIAGGKPEIGT